MAAVKKAVLSLFGGTFPEDKDVERLSRKLFLEVQNSVEDGEDDCITKNDLYHYISMKSQAGITSKSIDKLFKKIDISGDGSINSEEFSQVIRKLVRAMRMEQKDNERLMKSVPDSHIVPGSYRMNTLSGTNVFGVQVLKRSDMKQLWNIFNEVNIDGDGSLNLMEFKRHIAKNKPHLSHMSVSFFNTLDKNRSGSITFREMLQGLFPQATKKDIKILLVMADPQAGQPPGKPDLSLLEEVQSIFLVYDDDQSGSLDAEEFVHAMEMAGFSEMEAVTIFKEIDADASGEVSFEEFQEWYIAHAKKQAKILHEAAKDSDEEDD